MRTYYATIPAKTADEALTGIQALEASLTTPTREVEVRRVVPIGQKALVVYVMYEKGVVR